MFADRVLSASAGMLPTVPEARGRGRPRDGPVVFRIEGLEVEAVLVDHTVPCLAFALVEPPGVRPDPAKIAAGTIRPGAWVEQARKQIRSGIRPESSILIHGKPHSLASLRDAYFEATPATRIAYVTDTAWSEASRPGLLNLARGANRLYCDSFYAHAEIDKAEKYRHMTATQAAEFAGEAKVDELVLIHFSSRYEGDFERLVDEAKAIFPNTTAEIPPSPHKKSRAATKRS